VPTSPMTPPRRVAVFCGARAGLGPQWVAQAHAVGEGLARRGWGLVYGGGKVGLMGAVAQGALVAGGEVIGVIPERLRTRELAHEGVTRLEVVADMAERKTRMIELADAFITLPGGLGTLDELFEVLTLAQIGYHRKPIALFNPSGYWDALLAACRVMVEHGFLKPEDAALLRCADTIEATLEAVATD